MTVGDDFLVTVGLTVTEDDIHLAAYVMLQHIHLPFLVSPSGFINWSRANKVKAYRMATLLFVALGCQVPEVRVPGSGSPDLHRLYPRLRQAWEDMKGMSYVR